MCDSMYVTALKIYLKLTLGIIMKSTKFLYCLLFCNKNLTFICFCNLFLLLIYNSLCFMYKVIHYPRTNIVNLIVCW